MKEIIKALAAHLTETHDLETRSVFAGFAHLKHARGNYIIIEELEDESVKIITYTGGRVYSRINCFSVQDPELMPTLERTVREWLEYANRP